MFKIRKFAFHLAFLIVPILNGASLASAASTEVVNWEQSAIEEYLLPQDHPLHEKLSKLVVDPIIFEAPYELKKRGFQLFRHYLRGLMVSSHPQMKGYVFKKFINSIPLDEQLDNYIKRIRGARALAELIKKEDLTRIVTPKKWLYELPENFSDPETGKRAYLLVAERIDLMGTRETGEIYAREISKKTLKELALVLFTFRGLDSYLGNMPFTKTDQIAFIDTHRWEEDRSTFLWRVKSLMNPKSLEYAEKCYLKLQNKAQAKNQLP